MFKKIITTNLITGAIILLSGCNSIVYLDTQPISYYSSSDNNTKYYSQKLGNTYYNRHLINQYFYYYIDSRGQEIILNLPHTYKVKYYRNYDYYYNPHINRYVKVYKRKHKKYHNNSIHKKYHNNSIHKKLYPKNTYHNKVYHKKNVGQYHKYYKKN